MSQCIRGTRTVYRAGYARCEGAMKKPTQFERMVEKVTCSDHKRNNGVCLNGEEIVALLTREHRAVLRKVLQLRLRARQAAFATVLAKKRPDWHDAKIEVLDDLLAWLTARAK